MPLTRFRSRGVLPGRDRIRQNVPKKCKYGSAAATAARSLPARPIVIAVLTGLLICGLLPPGVFAAESPAPTPAPSPTPSSSATAAPASEVSATPAPAATPTTSQSPGPQPAPAATPTVSQSPVPQPSPSGPPPLIPNTEAQSQLIKDLTATQAYSLALQRSLAQSQLKLLTLGQQVLDADRELTRLDDRLESVRRDHTEVMGQLQADRLALTAVVRQLYKGQKDFFAALIESGGFGGLLRSLGYSEAALGREQALVKSLEADEAALAKTQADLEQIRAQQQAARDRLELARAELENQINVQRRLLDDLHKTIDDALKAFEATQTDPATTAQGKAQLIQLKAQTLLAQIEQTVWLKLDLSPTQLVPTDAALKASGRFDWPIPQATITQGFGPSPLALEPSYAGFPHFHTGIDLAVPTGTPIVAAADGVVIGARPMTDPDGNLVGYGNFVILAHDASLKTLYAHLLTILVREGQTVKRGQIIGLVGSTGNSTGAHTHFEVRVANTPVDPLNLLAPKDGK